MEYRFVGKSLPRTEDRRLLSGLGRYTADLAPPDCGAVFSARRMRRPRIGGSTRGGGGPARACGWC